MHWYWRLHLKECPNTLEMSTAREDDTRRKRVNSLTVYTMVTASWLGMPAHNCIPRGKVSQKHGRGDMSGTSA